MVTEVTGYILREPIGSGATATVWRGEAVGSPGRVVAIRLVPHTTGRVTSDALQRESEILGRLSHPHILPILAVVPTSDGLAVVTPYASGGSLAAMLARGSGGPGGPGGSGGASAEAVADIGARLASALAAVHGAGIVHRGVRPANVRFDRDRLALLGDVGISRLYGGVTTIAGTAAYLDPDLFDGREPDARSDLYALGITLYEALAGVPPYAGATTAQTVAAAERGRFVPLADRVQAPPALTAAIEAAFARDIRDRPAGAHELAEHLDEIRRVLDDGGPAPHPTATSGRAGVLGAVPSPARTSPAPPRRASHAAAPRRLPRMLVATAAMAIVLVPTAIVATSVQRGANEAADIDETVAGGDQTTADAPGTVEPGDDPPLPTIERAPAPSCDGLRVPDDGREVLFADLEGVGCSAVVAWDGQRLEVLGADGSIERYDLGARPGDVLRFGDWSCDGRDAPALYRPADGRLFTFDAIEPGTRTTATGTQTGTREGIPTVVTDAAGCDRMEVAAP